MCFDILAAQNDFCCCGFGFVGPWQWRLRLGGSTRPLYLDHHVLSCYKRKSVIMQICIPLKMLNLLVSSRRDSSPHIHELKEDSICPGVWSPIDAYIPKYNVERGPAWPSFIKSNKLSVRIMKIRRGMAPHIMKQNAETHCVRHHGVWKLAQNVSHIMQVLKLLQCLPHFIQLKRDLKIKLFHQLWRESDSLAYGDMMQWRETCSWYLRFVVVQMWKKTKPI